MTDYPVIFSAPMVQALLAGRKTMTRRLAWSASEKAIAAGAKRRPSPWQKVQPGSRLWVREAWKPHSIYAEMKPREMPVSKVFYLADNGYSPSNTPGLPSIHMPRWASRLTLIVGAVKIERLQDISADDAEAEGVFRHVAEHSLNKVFRSERGPTAVKYFRDLWIKLHGPESWDTNPEVVALTFRVVRENINQVKP